MGTEKHIKEITYEQCDININLDSFGDFLHSDIDNVQVSSDFRNL